VHFKFVTESSNINTAGQQPTASEFIGAVDLVAKPASK